MMKNIIDIPPKKKNNGYADPRESITTGVMSTLTVVPNQFMNVANGTIFEGIISGTYSQTTGPIVNPYIIMKISMKAKQA